MTKTRNALAALALISALCASSYASAADNSPAFEACYDRVVARCQERHPDAPPSDRAYQDCLAGGRTACDMIVVIENNRLVSATPQTAATGARPQSTATPGRR